MGLVGAQALLLACSWALAVRVASVSMGGGARGSGVGDDHMAKHTAVLLRSLEQRAFPACSWAPADRRASPRKYRGASLQSAGNEVRITALRKTELGGSSSSSDQAFPCACSSFLP